MVHVFLDFGSVIFQTFLPRFYTRQEHLQSLNVEVQSAIIQYVDVK